MGALPEKRFAKSFLAAIVVLLTGTAALNLVVNPFGQYPTQFVEPLVQTSRSQKVALLERRSEPPEGLILGSSRVLKLEPDYLEQATGYEFFNAGVNHGRVEDYLAFYRFFVDRFAQAPKVVVLGIDVSAFSDAPPFDGRLLNLPQLTQQLPGHIAWAERAGLWTDLIGWDQTKSSLKSVKFLLTGGFPEPIEAFRQDGLIEYLQRSEQMAEGTYDFTAALEYTQREYLSQFRAFERLSASRAEMFEELLRECQASETELYLFLTPLHPELASALKSETLYVDRARTVRDYLKRMKTRYHFRMRDFTDIASFAGIAKEFVDGVHPLESNTRLMINSLVGAEPQQAQIKHVSLEPAPAESKEAGDVVQ